MTGFGRAERRVGPAALAVEMRSVNQRFLKVSARLPSELTFAEEPLRKLVSGVLKRGQVDIAVRVEGPAGGVAGRRHLDAEALKRHLEEWRSAADATGLDAPVPLAALLGVPDVWVEDAPEQKEREALLDTVLETGRDALQRLCEMRRAEGEATRTDIAGLVAEVGTIAAAVGRKAPEVRSRLLAEMRARVEELLSGTSAADGVSDALRREIAHLVDRADVNEELKRLQSHLAQFQDALEGGGLVGRRLEFLLQEMHRELNTMAAKAQDAEISSMVVEGKVLVERAKEQSQNLE